MLRSAIGRVYWFFVFLFFILGIELWEIVIDLGYAYEYEYHYDYDYVNADGECVQVDR